MLIAAAPKGPPDRAAAAAPASGLVARILTTWLDAWERSRQRRHLWALDDRLLKDIGLTRADVEFETSKHFWVE